MLGYRAALGLAGLLLIAPLPFSGALADGAPKSQDMSPADVIILANPQALQSSGITAARTAPGSISFTVPTKGPIIRAASKALPAPSYAKIDPDILSRLSEKSLATIMRYSGLPRERLQLDPSDIGLVLSTGQVDPGNAGFILVTRASLPQAQGLIDTGKLLKVTEVSAADTLAALKTSRSAQPPEDSLVGIILPVIQNESGQPLRKVCAIAAEGEAAWWSLGYRRLPALAQVPGIQASKTFEGVGDDLAGLYQLVRQGECQFLIVTPDQARALLSALGRDGIQASIWGAVPKSRLASNWALTEGYRTAESFEFARQINPMPSPRRLELLASLGVSTIGEFNAAADRMAQLKYGISRTSELVLQFLQDEAKGRPNRLTPTQIRQARELVKAEEDRQAAARERAETQARAARRLSLIPKCQAAATAWRNCTALRSEPSRCMSARGEDFSWFAINCVPDGSPR